jgi:hypothetical protein
MSLRLRHLRLRAETRIGPFGADLPFETGLNILWADNTRGKSTCLQGILYALGLERMLSPRREIPLTYVMTTHLDDPETGERHPVLESSVWLELENDRGEIITVKRDDLLAIASMINARAEGMPSAPTLSAEEISRSYLLVSDGAAWKPLDEVASSLRARIAELAQAHNPTVEDVASEAETEVEHLMTYVADQNSKRNGIFRARQTEISQKVSVVKRLAALDEDLQKNMDSQKLRNLGSTISESIAPDHCPTCTQPIADTLLAQRAGAAIMPVEQNIEYIRAQRGIFQRLPAIVDCARA